MSIRRYHELSADELCALNDEQIARLIDIEVAEDGIAPVDPPTKPTLADLGVVQSEVAFRVGPVILKHEQDAVTVSKMEIMDEKYDWQIGSEYKWLQDLSDRRVEKVSAYRQDDIQRVAAALTDNSRKAREFESRQAKYSDFLRKTGDIRNNVWSTINEARDNLREIESARSQLRRYTELAEGDAEVAERFFRNTYKDNPAIIEKVIGTKQDNQEDEL